MLLVEIWMAKCHELMIHFRSPYSYIFMDTDRCVFQTHLLNSPSLPQIEHIVQLTQPIQNNGLQFCTRWTGGLEKECTFFRFVWDLIETCEFFQTTFRIPPHAYYRKIHFETIFICFRHDTKPFPVPLGFGSIRITYPGKSNAAYSVREHVC